MAPRRLRPRPPGRHLKLGISVVGEDLTLPDEPRICSGRTPSRKICGKLPKKGRENFSNVRCGSTLERRRFGEDFLHGWERLPWPRPFLTEDLADRCFGCGALLRLRGRSGRWVGDRALAPAAEAPGTNAPAISPSSVEGDVEGAGRTNAEERAD